MPNIDFRTLVLFILTFTALIAVHEFGHYFSARLLGMQVLEFAFGFPPRVASIERSGIKYSLNLIPFGGFVRILGQDDFTIHQEGEGDPRAFTSKPWWSQALVLVAGVTMNLIFALVVLTIAFATGTTAPTGDVRVDQVAANSPAEHGGIQVNDLIVSVDGRKFTRSQDLVVYVRQKARTATDVTLNIDRNGRPIPPVKLTPRAEPPEGEGPLGIRLEDVQGPVAVAVPEAFGQAVSFTGDVAGQIAALPGQLIASRGSGGAPAVSGPIGIFQVTGEVAQFGIPTFLKLVGMLSVNLAVINIVPFPGLDGGRLFFVLVSGLFRRRLSPELEGAIHAVGFLVLLGLLMVVSFFDIRRVAGG